MCCLKGNNIEDFKVFNVLYYWLGFIFYIFRFDKYYIGFIVVLVYGNINIIIVLGYSYSIIFRNKELLFGVFGFWVSFMIYLIFYIDIYGEEI